MGNTSISNLPAASVSQLTDLLPTTQGATDGVAGTTRKVTLQQALNALSLAAQPIGDAQPTDIALIARNGTIYAASPLALVTAGSATLTQFMNAGDAANAAAVAAAQATANAALSAPLVTSSNIEAALGYTAADSAQLATTIGLATSAQAAAQTAQATAASASTTASAASSAAGSAQSASSSAQSVAAAAQSAATAAQTAAQSAQSTANTANATAAAAANTVGAVQSTANMAQSAATAAQSVAATAQTNATAAQNLATSAQSIASAAQNTAVAAQTAATASQSSAAAALPKAGGTITGTLSFSGNPAVTGTTTIPAGFTAGQYDATVWNTVAAPSGMRVHWNNGTALTVSMRQIGPFSGAGTGRFPSPLNVYGRLEGSGNQAFSLYTRADLTVPGGTQVEMDSNNLSGPPDVNIPPNVAFGTTTNAARGIILDAIGPYASTYAFGTGYNSANTWLTGFYIKVQSGVTSVQNNGIYIDANTSSGVQYPLFIRSPAQAVTPNSLTHTVITLTAKTTKGTTVMTVDNPAGATLFGSVTDGVVVTVNSTSGFAAGQSITDGGTAVASGTTIQQVLPDGVTLILSTPVSATLLSGVLLTVNGTAGAATTTAATPIAVIATGTMIGNIENGNALFFASSSGMKSGDAVSGDNRIASGTTVSRVDPSGYIILSSATTGTIPTGTTITVGSASGVTLQPSATYLSLLNYFAGALVSNAAGTDSGPVSADMPAGTKVAVSSRPYWCGLRFLSSTTLTTGDGMTIPDNSKTPVIWVATSNQNKTTEIYRASLTLDGTFDNNNLTLAGQSPIITAKGGSALQLATASGTQMEVLNTTNAAVNYFTVRGSSGTTNVTLGTGGTGSVGLTVTPATTFDSSVTLAAAPTALLQAATKGYVDAAISEVSNSTAWKTGRYYSATLSGIPTGSTAWSAGTLYAIPAYIPAGTIIKKIGFHITAPSSSAFNAEMGLYADNSLSPGALVSGSDSGTFAVAASATGDQTFAYATPLIISTGGWYWLAINFSATGATVSCVTTSCAGPITALLGTGTIAILTTQATIGYSLATTFGSLPSTFGNGAFASTAVPCVVVGT